MVEIYHNGCDILSTNFTAIYTGLNEQIHQIAVHPNPSRDIFGISSDMPMESISIMDISGKLLFEFLELNTFEFSLDLRELNNGIYFAEVQTANTSSEQKLILQK
jgi:hypothetical protein